MSSDNWISVKNRKPDATDKPFAVLAIVDGRLRVYWVWPGDSAFPGMTHWQPIPDLPPKPDAFEEWSAPFIYNDADPLHWLKIDGAITSFRVARYIWDAAIASTKGQS